MFKQSRKPRNILHLVKLIPVVSQAQVLEFGGKIIFGKRMGKGVSDETEQMHLNWVASPFYDG